jgi:hypothetical protein
MKQIPVKLAVPKGFSLVFRPWITLKNGKRLYAYQVGKRAFPLLIPNAKA